jgi:hypothetical protein
MSLVTDSLTAGGTFFVTLGSGLQAYNELRRYQAVLTRLGITGFYKSYKDLGTAMDHVVWSVFTPWFFLPVKYSIWHLPARIKELKEASEEYRTATQEIANQYMAFLGFLFEKKNLPEGQMNEQDAEPGRQALSGEQTNERNAELREQEKAQQAELKALGMKSTYWTLIMLGSAAIFVATCISIISDLKP